jgi:hypothetical protein
MFLSTTILVKDNGITLCADISYGLDLIDLLTKGWREDCLLKAEICSHPQ